MGQQEVSHMEATTSDEEPSADISRKREHSSVANASEECPEKKKKADEPLETRVSRPRDKFFQCRYPDCRYQWPMKRNWNPKRHYRARHFPWFASVHLRSRNLDAFPGLAELWVEFLEMLALMVVKEPNIDAVKKQLICM